MIRVDMEFVKHFLRSKFVPTVLTENALEAGQRK